MLDIAPLRTRVSGSVLLPSDDGFADEIAAQNRAIVHTPELAVGVTTASDVAEVVQFARAQSLPVYVQSTGHGAEQPYSDGILVSTKRLDSIAIDRETRIATIGGGARWAPVVELAADAGLAPISGSSTNVGVVGYLAGGGLGPLARSHGFSSDYVRGYTVVTGTGEIVTATADENPDLYWALRGGKGGLGIVTEMQVELVELAALYAGSIFFAEEHIETVARGWAEWTSTAPDDVTTSIALFRFPDFDFIPEPVRGRTLLNLHFAYPGNATEGERLAAPLRALAPAYIDSLDTLSVRDVALIHNDPTEPGPGWARGALLSSIDQDFMTAWLAEVGVGKQVPFILSEIRHIGAAAATDVAGGSAAGGRASAFTFSLIGAPNPDLFAHVIPTAADRVMAAIDSWISNETNVNFAGAFRDRAHFESAWSGETFARLALVRARFDPDGVFPYGPAA